MKNKILTAEEKKIRRAKFFAEMNKEFPPVPGFVATNSGVLEKIPQTETEWDNFHENLQFVDGVRRPN
jgi:hypothetical protein